jgi:hypothetical protein
LEPPFSGPDEILIWVFWVEHISVMIAANGSVMLGRVDREVESLVLEADGGINKRRGNPMWLDLVLTLQQRAPVARRLHNCRRNYA